MCGVVVEGSRKRPNLNFVILEQPDYFVGAVVDFARSPSPGLLYCIDAIKNKNK